ncbi:serine proteinase inhibitor [Necator americanus]|uniref:Serine proteinase inhibitor n=1 Tax=Necator americanus TaxID=51031 RepID=W2TRM8_NECAM|nr:serine proteinase inhibitor [Necator americanus]ETN83761.1 serine proteinase inhibitor [Necator americanus]
MNDYGVPRLYVENRDVQVLSLPYKDPSFAFNIFLPKQRFNLAAVRKNLDGETIQKLLSQLRTTMVSITIPKMKMENDFKLKEALIAMGITEMFSDNANLTGIARTPPLYVSEADHKAVIEVDEAGTTAAGATSFNIMVRTAMRQPKIFVADHPFIFVLTKDKNPLFIGQFITFMNDFGVYRLYTEDQDVQVLSLSYKDTSYAFNIFLPKQKYNLATIRENFKGETIQKYLSQLDTTKVSITIPKIKIETDFKLKEALVAMGATEMFTANADLSGIVKAPPLYVSKAAHKAIIEVDEAGTTAAAATMMEIMAGSGMGEPKSFVADHPFMFVLTKDRNPLFIGQFV